MPCNPATVPAAVNSITEPVNAGKATFRNADGKAPSEAVSQKTCQQYIHKETFGGKAGLKLLPQNICHNFPSYFLYGFLFKNYQAMKNTISNLLFSFLFLSFLSCEKEKNAGQNPLPDQLNGVFVINEGAFLAGNASVTFFSSDSAYKNNDLFYSANGFPVGDILQSMSVFNNKAYLCVNNSQKVEVVSMNNFKREGVITGVNSPRFFCGHTTARGFVSDWSTNHVYLVNLNTYSIVDSILCGQGPEQMLISGNRLFICNGGGFSEDSIVTVADVNTMAVIAQVPCGVNPSSLCEDRDGKIWVLSKGSLGSDFTPSPDDAGGMLTRIDPVSLNKETLIHFNYDEHPVKISMNTTKDTLYFLNGNSTYTGAVFRMHINDVIKPASSVINDEFYALGIHPAGNIYTAKASFSSNTFMYRYTNNGQLIDSSGAGIGPNSFVFY